MVLPWKNLSLREPSSPLVRGISGDEAPVTRPSTLPDRAIAGFKPVQAWSGLFALRSGIQGLPGTVTNQSGNESRRGVHPLRASAYCCVLLRSVRAGADSTFPARDAQQSQGAMEWQTSRCRKSSRNSCREPWPLACCEAATAFPLYNLTELPRDRKSTRLNSSHT